MKIKFLQAEYDFDKDDAKIVVPLLLLMLALTFSRLNRSTFGASSRLLSFVLFSQTLLFGHKGNTHTVACLAGVSVPVLQEPRNHFARLSGLSFGRILRLSSVQPLSRNLCAAR
jgi:hypothetical protein